MKTNQKGIDLIKYYEGTGPVVNGLCQPYKCSAGYWTIGYGNRRINPTTPVTGSTSPISLAQANTVMLLHIEAMEHDIDAIMTNRNLTSNQYSALASWVYNLGIDRLRSSTLLKKLNSGDLTGAADEFLKWNKETKNNVLVVSKGLDNRRKAERALFLS
jgi:GH24 family phage-related lysozyme (muramidase)